MLEKHCLLLKFDVKPFMKYGSLKGLSRINEKIAVQNQKDKADALRRIVQHTIADLTNRPRNRVRLI